MMLALESTALVVLLSLRIRHAPTMMSHGFRFLFYPECRCSRRNAAICSIHSVRFRLAGRRFAVDNNMLEACTRYNTCKFSSDPSPRDFRADRLGTLSNVDRVSRALFCAFSYDIHSDQAPHRRGELSQRGRVCAVRYGTAVRRYIPCHATAVEHRINSDRACRECTHN